MGEDSGEEILGAPGGAEPSVLTAETTPFNNARRKAADLLTLAAHPKLLSAGTNMVTEDSRTADREAYIGLGWAMVYLADAVSAGAAFEGGETA